MTRIIRRPRARLTYHYVPRPGDPGERRRVARQRREDRASIAELSDRHLAIMMAGLNRELAAAPRLGHLAEPACMLRAFRHEALAVRGWGSDDPRVKPVPVLMTRHEVLAECRERQQSGREVTRDCARAIVGLCFNPRDPAAVRAVLAFWAAGSVPDDASGLWRAVFPSYDSLDSDGRLMADMLGTYLLHTA